MPKTDKAFTFKLPAFRGLLIEDHLKAQIDRFLERAPLCRDGSRVTCVAFDHYLTRDAHIYLVPERHVMLGVETGDRGLTFIETSDLAEESLPAFLDLLMAFQDDNASSEDLGLFLDSAWAQDMVDNSKSNFIRVHVFDDMVLVGQEYLPTYYMDHADMVFGDAGPGYRAALLSVVVPPASSAHEKMAQAALFTGPIRARLERVWPAIAETSEDGDYALALPGADEISDLP